MSSEKEKTVSVTAEVTGQTTPVWVVYQETLMKSFHSKVSKMEMERVLLNLNSKHFKQITKPIKTFKLEEVNPWRSFHSKAFKVAQI